MSLRMPPPWIQQPIACAVIFCSPSTRLVRCTSECGSLINLMHIPIFGFNLRSVQASTFEERRKLFPSQIMQPPPTPMQASPNASPRSPSSSDKGKLPDADKAIDPAKALFYPSASTSLSPGSTETTVTCHLITPQLALLALIPTQTFEGRRGLVEYNVVYFREGVQEIWQVEREARTRG
jgi:hypothetical protein